jgi:hypothetical protein
MSNKVPGNSTALKTCLSSCFDAGVPVLVPVKTTPSDKKNSAALAVSIMSRSDVMA